MFLKVKHRKITLKISYINRISRESNWKAGHLCAIEHYQFHGYIEAMILHKTYTLTIVDHNNSNKINQRQIL